MRPVAFTQQQRANIMEITVEAAGKRYIHYENWLKRRGQLWSRPREPGVFRVDIELARPAHFLAEVRVDHNPHGPIDTVNGLGERVRHGGSGQSPHTVYYACDEWTTAWGVVEAEHPDGGESLRFLAESSRQGPALGERLILYCSSGTVWTEPWGANRSNHFAFLRDRFWYVSHIEFEPPWRVGWQYPLIDQVCSWDLGRGTEDYLPPSYLAEAEDEELVPFFRDIFRDLDDPTPLYVCVDWLEDHRGREGAGLARYLRGCLSQQGSGPSVPLWLKVVWDRRHRWHCLESGRKPNLRTLRFALVNLFQDAYAASRQWGRLLRYTRFAGGPFRDDVGQPT
jgi:hypothetical protein